MVLPDFLIFYFWLVSLTIYTYLSLRLFAWKFKNGSMNCYEISYWLFPLKLVNTFQFFFFFDTGQRQTLRMKSDMRFCYRTWPGKEFPKYVMYHCYVCFQPNRQLLRSWHRSQRPEVKTCRTCQNCYSVHTFSNLLYLRTFKESHADVFVIKHSISLHEISFVLFLSAFQDKSNQNTTYC